MTENRDPSREPFHPNPRHRQPHPAIALREKHAASAALAVQAMGGAKLNAADRQAAADLVTAVQTILTEPGPMQDGLAYLLESTTTAIRFRRQVEVEAA